MLPSKWENLSRCSTKIIYFCKKLPLTLDCGQSKYSHYIFNFRRAFYGSFPMLFPKAPASWFRKILNWFLLHCTSIFMSSKSVSQIFKILFFKLEISIFWYPDNWPPRKIAPRLGLGFQSSLGLVIGLGANRQLPRRTILPWLGLGLVLGLGGAIFLGGNCPRTQYFCPSWDLF